MSRKKLILTLVILILAILLLSSAFGVIGYYFWSKSKLVYQAKTEEYFNKNLSSYFYEKPASYLSLTAGAYVVSDLNSKEKIVEKNAKQTMPIASVTKLMTAIVAQELLKPEQKITISKSAWLTYGNTGHFRIGETLPLNIMYYPLLLSSSNDVAEAIAETAGRLTFIARMNSFAQQIGMANTYFEDPSGLSPHNVSTPEDLTKLAIYLVDKRPELLAITREKSYCYGRETWTNYNNISTMKYYVGGKNGYTEEANRTLLSVFSVPINKSTSTNDDLITEKSEKKERLLAVVLLQSADRKSDTKNLINYLAKYVSFASGKNGFVPIN